MLVGHTPYNLTAHYQTLGRCFLSEETRVISNIIENILQCALDFRSCLPRGTQSTGGVPNDSWTKTLGINTSQVNEEDDKRAYQILLSSLLRKLSVESY